MNKKIKDIVIMAISQEAPTLADLDFVHFCGVGKINAAVCAADIIHRYQPRRIINFGTAGGITVGSGFYSVTRFVQRDMRCVELGCLPGQTPFESDVVLDLGSSGLTCSTGDDFVTDPKLDIAADIVDMESYALAKVCKQYSIEFECWKFVSDQADSNAGQDWTDQVRAGEPLYIAKLSELDIYHGHSTSTH